MATKERGDARVLPEGTRTARHTTDERERESKERRKERKENNKSFVCGSWVCGVTVC
jgi:hypothetical protein